MCARYFIEDGWPVLCGSDFNATMPMEFQTAFQGAQWNICPTNQVPAIRLNAESQKEVVRLRWGLVPSWADDLKVGVSKINARSETVATLSSYRAAFKRRRCLVLASGFYEWRTVGKGKSAVKTPFMVQTTDQPLFAFAGLWESWKPTPKKDADPAEQPGDEGPQDAGAEEAEEVKAVETTTIITCDPNHLMATIHDRMPVILPRDLIDVWLDPEINDAEALNGLLVPYPSELMKATEVSKAIGNVKFKDDPRLPA